MSDEGIPIADLKPGDRVVMCGRFAYSIWRVDRVTETQIIIGTARFRRKDGLRVGATGWECQRLETSARAFTLAKKSTVENLLSVRIEPTRASITAARKRLDVAEALLRECGEWKDEP